MANCQEIFLTKDLSFDEVFNLYKKANEEYFLGYFQIEKIGNKTLIVSEPKNSNLEPDNFEVYYMKNIKEYFFEDEEVEEGETGQKSPLAFQDVKVQLETPHRQRNDFMWYVKDVMAKYVLDYCGQDDIYDEGTTWYKTTEAPHHTPTKDEKEIRNQFKTMNRWWRFGNYSISKETKDKFGLKKTMNPANFKRIFGFEKNK